MPTVPKVIEGSVQNRAAPAVFQTARATPSNQGAATGQAVGGIGDALFDQGIKLQEEFNRVRIQQDNRRDTVDRARLKNQYDLENSQEFAKTDKESDFSQQDILGGYGASLSKRKRDILSSHIESGASEDSISQLAIDLNDSEASATGVAAAKATEIGSINLEQTRQNLMSPIMDDAGQNPQDLKRILEEDIPNTYNGALRGGYGGAEELKNVQEDQERAVLASMDRLLIQGRTEEAEKLLIDDGINRFLSPPVDREQRRRIENVFKSKRDIETTVNMAFLVKQAELKATREHINLITGDLNLISTTPEGTDNVIDSPAVLAPLTGEEPASESMQSVARLFDTSRKLLLGGETQLASGHLSLARFIMENSPAIQAQKELDKPVSPDFAAIMGVPMGSTMRSVLGVIPPSIEEQAEARAEGAATGKGRVEGGEQLGFIAEASEPIIELLDEIENNKAFLPLVGVGGSLRSTGQITKGILTDLGADKILESARELAFSGSDLSLDEQEGMFDDPTLSGLSILENSIGLTLARLRTPSGRIPVDVIKRSIADVKLTGLTSEERVVNRLKLILTIIDRRKKSLQKRFGLGEEEESTLGLPKLRLNSETGKLEPVGDE